MTTQLPAGDSAFGKVDTYYWEDSCWINPPFDEYRIIELDPATFTNEGTLAAATRQVDELAKVEINAVVISPDTILDRSARPIQHFVDTCHFRGIAVGISLNGIDSKRTETGSSAASTGFSNWSNIQSAVQWLRDFHVDALCNHRPDAEQTLRQLRNAVNQLTARTGRQYYLLVDCEASPVSVIGRHVRRLLCRTKQPASVLTPDQAAPTATRWYRRDWLYEPNFARALRKFFGRVG